MTLFFLPKTEYKHNTVYLSPLSTELMSSSFRHFRFFSTALFLIPDCPWSKTRLKQNRRGRDEFAIRMRWFVNVCLSFYLL